MSGQRNEAQELTFREWLADQLDALNLTQDQFADSIGVNQATVSTWISGKSPRPSKGNCRRIAGALGLDERTVLNRAGYATQRVRRPTIQPLAVPQVDKDLEVWLAIGRRFSPEARAHLVQFLELIEESN